MTSVVDTRRVRLVSYAESEVVDQGIYQIKGSGLPLSRGKSKILSVSSVNAAINQRRPLARHPPNDQTTAACRSAVCPAGRRRRSGPRSSCRRGC